MHTIEVSVEEFRRWQEDPVTQKLVDVLGEDVNNLSNGWINGAYADTVVNARNSGKSESLVRVITTIQTGNELITVREGE